MTKFLGASLILLAFCCSDVKKAKPKELSAKDLAYLDAIHANDTALGEPGLSDWRSEHPEKIQTFDDYVSGETFVPDANHKVIYLQPIGKFEALQMQAIELTRQYLEIFFQRKTAILPAVSGSSVPSDSRRQNSGHEQIKTGYILNEMLYPNVPEDAIVVMAISEKDLYPSDDWNYVFGQASYEKRIGVSSIYRLQDEHLSQANFKTCLKRLFNVSSHEIGHMLTLKHCQFALCTMNGSNNMNQTDDSPNRLCSDCQKKLTWNLKYDNPKRLRELRNFLSKNLPEDAQYLEKDLAVLPK